MAQVVVGLIDVDTLVLEVFGRNHVECAKDVHQTVDDFVDHRARTVIVDIMTKLGF